MSKKSIIKNHHWENYPFKVQVLIDRSRNFGRLSNDDATKLEGELFVHSYGSHETGAQITNYWILNKDKQKVISSSYTFFGPPSLQACADMAALLCKGKSFDEIEKLNYKSIEFFLKDHPNSEPFTGSKRSSIYFAVLAVRSTLKAYLNKDDQEQKEVVCKCNGMDRTTIDEAIVELKIDDLETLSDYALAGSYCGRCIKANSNNPSQSVYLEDILNESKEKLKKNQESTKIPDKPFEQMDEEEKRAVILSVIDENIRQMLIMDGGDMEILDIKNNGNHTDVYIRYLGACSGCASANTGTLFAIEGILKQKIDPNIRVLPV